MLKSKNKVFILLTILLLALSLVACAVSEPTSTSSKLGPTSPSSEKPTESASPPTVGEPTDIEFFIYDLRGVGENAQPIEDALNEITESSIGVKVKFAWFGAADYVTQLNLAISTNEGYDLCTLMPREGGNFVSLHTNGMLMDITDFVDSYGADMMAVVGDYRNAMSSAGRVFGIPTIRDFSSFVGILIRKDLVEQVGMLDTMQNLSSFKQLEEVYGAILDQTGVVPVGGTKNVTVNNGLILGDGEFANSIRYDSLGDALYCVFADLETAEVSLLPEHPTFRAEMEMVRRWYNNGWVYKDSIVTDDHPDTLMKAGVIASSITNAEVGTDKSKTSAIGYDLLLPVLKRFAMASYNVNKFGTAVPVSADEPEAAIMWLNELYKSSEMMNLITWGEEGIDYVIKGGEGVFPDGIDAQSVRYHTVDFLVGNGFLSLPWQGQGANFREEGKKILAAAPVSPYMGFTPALSDLTNEVATITAVNDQYRAKVFCGSWSDADYTAYIAALRTAGVDKYLNAFQQQLDAWIEANK
ncbi:MAG: DUF3502 domain-containing protein [Saccharofermentanales bacterium]|jgi:putative aldouronate transport system substrate-binding protein